MTPQPGAVIGLIFWPLGLFVTRRPPGLRRPLLLIHGLADDNVFPLHALRLSATLLAAGRPHTVLPIPGPVIWAAAPTSPPV